MFLARRCVVCGDEGAAVCLDCERKLTPAAPKSEALFAYEGCGRALVLALKRNRGRLAVPWLASRLAASAEGAQVDVVTWAPTTAARRRQRGYDQAELLANGVARQLRAPVRSLLRRTSSEAQHGRPRRERLSGPAFSAVGPVGGAVLLIDDVTTTGATLRAAERVLYDAGAAAVQARVVA
ncbi:MAG: hypothetical protein JWL70_3055, partial [Acidimicrobiia bacterium]|nr:hypothetical protein [Acidimicrobiia bacterium]